MIKHGLALLLFVSLNSLAGVPATPVMTLYQFDGPESVPYYSVTDFIRSGATRPAGSLRQGSSVIPCLVVRNGVPLTDAGGTPYVGFRVVVDTATATPDSTAKFRSTVSTRKQQSVQNHHCDSSVRHIISIRKLFSLNKAPFFEPPASTAQAQPEPTGELDRIIRAFHNSAECRSVNQRLTRRRAALDKAWSGFMSSRKQWPQSTVARAKHLDYTMRTAMFEGHLDRGCNAYGTCERNIIALSIRNRGRESCAKWQGCRFPGDFQGVSSKVSQYNIWDEFLTQTSALTSCFLRDDLGTERVEEGADDPRRNRYFRKLQALYRQNLEDTRKILFGSDADLVSVFPDNRPSEIKNLRHYYHAPAMGKCYPGHRRVEYMSGAVATRGNDHILIANTRIEVGERRPGGYLFRKFEVELLPQRDATRVVDSYPGFVVDGRKVSLKPSSGCYPWGVPSACDDVPVGRYRKAPYWLSSGTPLALTCRVQSRGEMCLDDASPATVTVGGRCDTEMRPVANVR